MTETGRATVEVVSTWYGSFALEDGKVVEQRLVPPESRVERALARRRGERTPEETALFSSLGGRPALTRDRRLAEAEGVVRGRTRSSPPTAEALGIQGRDRRALFLETAEAALRSSWDPSIHVEEAVRTMTDLDEVHNLLGERLVSWAGRDLSGEGDEGPEGWAKSLDEGVVGPDPDLAPEEPELVEARRQLARLYTAVGDVRSALEAAVTEAVPRRTPNVSALLGPLLAARLISQAGGLDRLARLPASTVQVLGAEKAFFEHLRGRAPPPRHGLLFLHPTIQGAPRRLRGKLARALAGKVSIAARLDQAGAPLRPDLKAAYDARQGEVRAQGARPTTNRGARSAPPLHRAAEDG